jgi:hypothetical protein
MARMPGFGRRLVRNEAFRASGLRGDGMGFGSGVAWIVTLFQETRELVAIEPPPACPQAGEKFEFAACENRHNSARLDACGRAKRKAAGHYLFCIPAYCLPL